MLCVREKEQRQEKDFRVKEKDFRMKEKDFRMPSESSA